MLFAAFFAPNAKAATNSTGTSTPSTGQGTLTPNSNPALFGQEKQQLSFEYNNKVLKGKETQAVFEQHYLAFMHKWNLGGYQNLHKALTTTRSQSVANTQKALAVSPNTAYVSAVLFPEEQLNYCGNATMATVLVEDSFKWPGANYDRNFNYSIVYNPYVVSQPQDEALGTENQLGDYYLSNDDGPGLPGTLNGSATPYSTYNGLFHPLMTDLNFFVNGKGGSYAYVDHYANYRANLTTDSAQGWDIADGIQVPYDSVVLTGWTYEPGHVRDHWIASTYTPDGGWTSEIADPVYNAPGYGLPDFDQSKMSAHEDVNSALIMTIMTPFGYFW